MSGSPEYKIAESIEVGLADIASSIRGALGSSRDSMADSVKTALVKESYGTRESRIESAIYRGLRDGIREGMIAAEKLRIANDKDTP